MKNENEMTRKEFENLPMRQNWAEEIFAESLVILPQRRLHHSGYRCIDFVAITKDGMVRLSGYSDVMHIDGIGGFGDRWLEKFKGCLTAVHPVGWSMDCLKKSGLLRIFASSYRIKCGSALSSFEMWAIPREEELKRRDLRLSGMTYQKIADKYHVTIRAIWQIFIGKTWGHVFNKSVLSLNVQGELNDITRKNARGKRQTVKNDAVWASRNR